MDLTTIFLPNDKLLASAGSVPVYYWFIRSLKVDQLSRVRDFLVQFEQERRQNRTAAQGKTATVRPDSQLLSYDQYNRNTNDLQSHIERIEILRSRFQRYLQKSRTATSNAKSPN